VNSGPVVTSPRTSFANFSLQSPTSPFAPNAPPHGHAGFGPGPVYSHKRLSISSVASSNYQFREGSIDQALEGYGTPEAHDHMGMSMMDSPAPGGPMDAYLHGQEQGRRRGTKEEDEFPPPWSDLKTKAGKDRKRLPLACIACRRKKIRCSGQKPACKHCLRSRVPCVYKTNTRKATPRTDYMAMLDKRLKRMEDRVIKLVPKDSEAASLPRAIVKPTAGANLKSPKRSRKRVAEEAFGADKNFDSWLKPGSASDKDATPIKVEEVDEQSLFSDGEDELPSREIQLHLAEVYFDYVYGQSYPLLHKPTFMRNLSSGKIPPILILAVCAVSARFSTHPELRGSPPFLRGEAWAAPARQIALRRYDSPNITVLIVYILLGLHEFGTCHGGRSWMFAGMAQRMAFMLQLHKIDESSSSTDENGKENISTEEDSHTDVEVRRRVMWSCFLMDRFISSGSDRPMCIPEDSISIPLPVQESLFLSGIKAEANSMGGQGTLKSTPNLNDLSSNLGTTAYLIRLVSIWGKLITYFNLGAMEAEKVPMWDPTSHFKDLASMLKDFKFSPDLVWSEDNLATHRAVKRDNQFVFVHIVYQHLRLFCHRFALPGWGILISRKMPRSFLAESGRIALDAANQVSMLVKEAIHSNVTAPFAGYAAFYASTVHIQGQFAKSVKVVQRAEENLKINMQYLERMRNWWGMFHFMLPDLKKLFQATRDASNARSRANGQPEGSNDAEDNNRGGGNRKGSGIFQYGDWLDKYSKGHSTLQFEESPQTPGNKDDTNRGVLGATDKKLPGVEEYFEQVDKGELHPRGTQDDVPIIKRTKSQKGRSLMPDMPDSASEQTRIAPSSSLHASLPSRVESNEGSYGTVPTYISTTDPHRQAPYPLSIHTSHQMPSQHPLLQSPTTANSDFSAWPQADYFIPPMPPNVHANFSGPGGLAAAPGMSAGWFMPWNMQPPPNGLAMVGVAGVSGFNLPFNGSMGASGVAPDVNGMHDWDSWVQGMPGDDREVSGR
jgi:hypothetical protein